MRMRGVHGAAVERRRVAADVGAPVHSVRMGDAGRGYWSRGVVYFGTTAVDIVRRRGRELT
jgi:hypothetical protein